MARSTIIFKIHYNLDSNAATASLVSAPCQLSKPVSESLLASYLTSCSMSISAIHSLLKSQSGTNNVKATTTYIPIKAENAAD